MDGERVRTLSSDSPSCGGDGARITEAGLFGSLSVNGVENSVSGVNCWVWRGDDFGEEDEGLSALAITCRIFFVFFFFFCVLS